MKKQTPLVEILCPIRSRGVRPESAVKYHVREQMQEYTGNSSRLPGEIRASDGGTDGTKITDKSGDTTAVCWVAREVFGESNPQWKLFRTWLLNEAPAWFRSLYISHGENFAKWIHNKPKLKAVIRVWMDSRICNKPCFQHA